jgi:hypothetical protein
LHTSRIPYVHQFLKKRNVMNEETFERADLPCSKQGTPPSSPALKGGASCGGLGEKAYGIVA